MMVDWVDIDIPDKVVEFVVIVFIWISVQMDGIKLEPLRTLDDFILKARFGSPDVGDLERWAKRIKENLIYYQTNYFLTAIIVFLIVG
jgi:hypothetical protein